MSDIKNYRSLSQEADRVYLSGRPTYTRSQHIEVISQVKQQTIFWSLLVSLAFWGKRKKMFTKLHTLFREPGKRVSGLAINTATVGPRLHHLIVTDTNINWHYLVDTGTQVSVSKSKRSLTILQVNINGFKNKPEELKLLIRNTHADIITMVPKTTAYKWWNCQVIRAANCCHLIPSNRFLDGFPDPSQFAAANRNPHDLGARCAPEYWIRYQVSMFRV